MRQSQDKRNAQADEPKDRDNLATPEADKQYFFDISSDVFAVLNLSGKVLQVNPAHGQVLGTDARAATSFLELVHPDDEHIGIGHLKRMQAGLPSLVEVRCLTRDGSYKWMSWSATPVPEVNRFYAIGRDISRQKAAESRVKEFYSTMSHELRTPLASITGVLGLIVGGLLDANSDEGKELVLAAKESSDRLIRLINNILDIQKIESGNLDVTRQLVQPRMIAEVAVKEIRGLADQMGATVVVKCPPDMPAFEADRDKLLQVMNNLLSNAIKFSPAGETVEVSIMPVEDALRFEIKDKGPGIPEHHAHKLFQKFQQLDSSDSRKVSGTGLGLAICKALIESHRGKIGYRNNEDRGCTFWFELPLDA